MKAVGVAENNVYARESGYSNAIENSAIIGVAPEFVYTEGLAVEEVTVKFELDNSVINNTLGTYAENNDGFKGIKRLNVFMFFEDVNMLLPVETFYDETANIVYTKTDRVGTYCLMDMEIFFQNLGIEPTESADVEVSGAMSGNMLDSEEYMCYNVSGSKARSNESKYKDNFDVVFIVDEISYSDVQLEGITKEIHSICEKIFENSENVTISVYGLNGLGETQSTWYGRADNIDGVESMLGHIERKELNNTLNMVLLSDCVDYVILAHEASEELSARQEYGFIFFDPENKNDKKPIFLYRGGSSEDDNYGMALLTNLGSRGTAIDFCTITDSYQKIKEQNYSYSYALSGKTGGENIGAASYESVVNDCIMHIYGEIPENVNAYKAIIATGYNTVVLDKPITRKYADNANKKIIYNDYEFDSDELEDCADTDKDNLWDFEEILFTVWDVPVIEFDEQDNVILPKIDEVLHGGKLPGNPNLKKFPVPAYVESGRNKALEQYGDCYYDFLTYSVLPIRSDPTEPDGDFDGLDDTHDMYPLSESYVPQAFKEFINSDVISYRDIIWIAGNSYVCAVPISKLILSDVVSDFIWSNDSLTESDLALLIKCLITEVDCECFLAVTCVGNEEIYYFSELKPERKNDIQNYALSLNAVDTHKSDYINNSSLKDNILYKSFGVIDNFSKLIVDTILEIATGAVDNSFDFFEMILRKIVDKSNLDISVFDKDGTRFAISTLKGALKSPAKIVCGLLSIPSTLMVTTQSYIEYAYWYKHINPEASIFEAANAASNNTSDKLVYCLLSDFDTRVLQGTPESRGEFLGEVIFDIAFSEVISKPGKHGNDLAKIRKKMPSYSYLDDVDGVLITETLVNPEKGLKIRLKNSNYQAFWAIAGEIDNFDEFVDFLYKHNDMADDIIERFSATPKQQQAFIDALNSHFDDFIKYSEKFNYNNEFVRTFITYPQYSDDILKYAGVRGEYFVKCVIKESQKGEDSIKSLISRVTKSEKVFSQIGDEISYSRRFAASSNYFEALDNNGLSSNEFLKNREIHHNSIFLDYATKQKMASIREAVPFPDENTVMSKVIPQGDIDKYLSGEFYQVGGFVTKADDVANCKNYMDYYNNLALGYSFMGDDGKIVYRFYKDTDTELGVIRFKSKSVNQDTLRIPYGKGFDGIEANVKSGKKKIFGYKEENLPFTGNGFAGEKGVKCITPEYEFTSRVDIMDGAELYIVTKDGDEILMAIYNEKALRPDGKPGKFVRLEDIGNE